MSRSKIQETEVKALTEIRLFRQEVQRKRSHAGYLAESEKEREKCEIGDRGFCR